MLHAVGIAHSDVREHNTVWLGDEDVMLIDLEHCRFESSDLPDGLWLCEWDEKTLQVVEEERKKKKKKKAKEMEKTGKERYTCSSDMYSLGKMLEQVLARIQGNRSALAEDFTTKLKAKQLTASQGLAHQWLSGI